MDSGYHSKFEHRTSGNLGVSSLLNSSPAKLGHSSMTASFAGGHSDAVRTIGMHGESDSLRRTVAEQESQIRSLLAEVNELRSRPTRVEVRSNMELENRVSVLNTELERVRAVAAERALEIESLREKIAILERQLHQSSLSVHSFRAPEPVRTNLSVISHDQNLKSHIENELRNRLRDHETRGSNQSAEITRLQSLISEKVRESETWQSRVAEVEHNHQRILDETKRRWEGEVNAHVEKELRAKTVEFEHAEALYKNEIERLRADLEMASSRIVENDRIHAEHLEESKRKWQTSVRLSLEQELSMKMREFDERLHESQREIERYRDALREKEREIELLNSRMHELENSYKHELSETEKSLNIRMTSTIEQETRTLSQKYEASIRELCTDIEKLKNTIHAKEEEITRLTRHYEESQRQIELRIKEQLTSEFNRKENEYKEALRRLERELEAALHSAEMSKQESQRLQAALSELERAVPGRISVAVKEKEEMLRGRFETELTKALNKAKEEIDSWTRKYYELERELNEKLRHEVEIRERRIGDIEREYEELRRSYESLERSIPGTVEDAKSKLESHLRSRFEAEITAKIREYDTKLASARTEYEKAVREIESREHRIAELESILRDWQSRFSDLEKSIPIRINEVRQFTESSLKVKFEGEISVLVRDYEQKLGSLKKEIEQLKAVIHQKEDEIKSWQHRHHELELSIPVTLEREQSRWESETRAIFQSELSVKIQEDERRFALSRQETEKLRGELEILMGRLKSSENELVHWQKTHESLEVSIPRQIESAKASWESSMRYKLESEIGAKVHEYEVKISILIKDMEKLEREIEVRDRRVESLSLEIRGWESRYADLEKSIPITLNEARSSWEASMRVHFEAELRQRIHEYEGKISVVEGELERFKVLLKDKEHSVEGLRITLQEKEKALPGIIDSHVSLHESEIKTRFEVELSRTLKEYDEQLLVSRAEVERQKHLLKVKEEECERLRTRLVEIERSIPHILKENEAELRVRFDAELRVQLREHEIHLGEKEEEVKRLKLVIEERAREVESWRRRIGELEVEYRERIEDFKRQTEIQVKARLETEVNVTVHSKVEEVRRELEAKIFSLVRDNEQLAAALTLKTKEINEFRFRTESETEKHEFSLKILKERSEAQIREFLEEKESILQDLSKARSDFETLTVRFEEYKRLQSSIEHDVQFHAERSALETQILQLKQRVEELDSTNRIITSENKLLAKTTKEKHLELEALRQKLRSTESRLSLELNELQRKAELQNLSSMDAQEAATRMKAETSRHATELSQVSGALQNTKAELSRVYELLEKRKQEDGRNLATIDALRSELRRYQEEGNARLSAQSSGLQERVVELERRLEESEREKISFRSLYQKNAMELTEKNKELVEKIRELDGHKVEFERILRELGSVESTRRVVVTSSYGAGDRKML